MALSLKFIARVYNLDQLLSSGLIAKPIKKNEYQKFDKIP